MHSNFLVDAVASTHARIFAGCTISCFTTEHHASGGLLVATTILHVLVVVEKLPAIFVGAWRRRRAREKSFVVGARSHIRLALMYLFVSAVNMSLTQLYIDMPFQIVFRSSSVIFSIVCGRLLYGQSYSTRKYASCALLSAGVIIATPYDSPHVVGNRNTWMFGVALMFLSSAVSALMGHEQRRAYTLAIKHNRGVRNCADEIMLMSHLVGVLVFSAKLLYTDAFNRAWPTLDDSGADFLIAIAHYTCVSAVYDLVAEHGGLHCAFVLSVRKFASLLLSVYYFDNRFTLVQYVGTALVAIGTALFYSDHRGATNVHRHRAISANKQN